MECELRFFAYNVSGDAFKVPDVNSPFQLLLVNVKNLSGGNDQVPVLGPLVLIDLLYFVAENNLLAANKPDFIIVLHFQKVVVYRQQLHLFL